MTDFIIFYIITATSLEEGSNLFFDNLTQNSKDFTMYLNLHLIIDLITNTLNNCFLDNVKMESIKDKGDGELKIIYHSKEEERKYEITWRTTKTI